MFTCTCLLIPVDVEPRKSRDPPLQPLPIHHSMSDTAPLNRANDVLLQFWEKLI